jgi:hypothetical protein
MRLCKRSTPRPSLKSEARAMDGGRAAIAPAAARAAESGREPHPEKAHVKAQLIRDLIRLRTGTIDETRKLFRIFIYLWVLLSLFSFHKALVFNEEYLIYDQRFALINALALAKVILIGEYFHVEARSGSDRSLSGECRTEPHRFMRGMMPCARRLVISSREQPRLKFR